VPLQDELRELFAKVGPQVFDDADSFRGAFDDFVPEGAASTGELRLLVDAIATGSFQRLVTQLAIDADPTTAIAAEAERLARDRGTVETDGARWALTALAYARGVIDNRSVTTRPSALGQPSAPQPQEPPASAPALSPDTLGSTRTGATAAEVTSTAGRDAPPRPGVPGAPPPPARSRPARIAAFVAGAVVLAVAAVGAIVLLGDDGTSTDDTDASDKVSASDAASGSASAFPPPPGDLPSLPSGFPATFELDVRLPQHLALTVSERFGTGVATEVFAGGDPMSPEVQADTGPEPTAERVRALVAAGVPARVKYYALRQVGQGTGDAGGGDLLDLMEDRDEMAAYWTNVRELLTELSQVGAPVELLAEPDVPGDLLSASPDATTIPFAVGSTGVAGLDGLPDTFAGWAQAWLTLRDELAPDVRIGITVSPWQIQNDFLPDLPSTGTVEEWAAAFGESYATLGARFDFLDNVMTYAEGGALGEAYVGDDHFFNRLLTWVSGISAATDTRVVLDNVPVGNSVYRSVDDTDFHYRDSWVEWILGADDFANLVALRDAGVIGIVFGVDGAPASTTCPCDAAGDGVTNGGVTGRKASSADDDGGYLAERLQAYAVLGGLPL